ncbi:TrmB family transcriptional regulator [Halosolutus gelatinilyticus]|uniref:TrmB family transcriptional regulator n=1 Tax=Halosolutus gelatinilyticus TaxID=2931975 RepID=UPI001FF5E838|nr:helix-turn-helix domain-containing protein [Halosolutus gelatinilyticus]
MSATQEAVLAMEALGLTEYEARCFVALTRISNGTAKEVGQVADIPRSRVYDTIEGLERRGLVEIQQSDPREFKAVPIEMAVRRIREDYDSRINAAENALQQVEEPETDDDEGMWAITQPDHVTERIELFLDAAEDEIHYVIVTEEVVERSILTHLDQAANRGVEVVVEVSTDDLGERLREAVPDADVVVASDLETTNPVYGEWPGQLLMVDNRSVVAAGIEETDLPDVTQELAVWTYGRDHGFAVWIRELLNDRHEKLSAQ